MVRLSQGLRLACQARVGVDVVSDILVSGIHKSGGSFLLMDLGMNGEVVLKKGGASTCGI